MSREKPWVADNIEETQGEREISRDSARRGGWEVGERKEGSVS